MSNVHFRVLNQAIARTNDGLLSVEPLTNVSEIWIRIQYFTFKDMHLKLQSTTLW